MAEVTAMRNNALPYPVYGLPWVETFPLLDADGDPISPSSPDSEVSKNGDTFADCTNEATEIATSSGVCYLSLTGTEMTADKVTVRVQSTGAKTTVLNFAPRKLVSIRAGTSASAGSSTSTIVLDASASAVDDFYNGMIVVAVIDSNTEVRMISDYTGSTQTATVVPDWNVAPDNNDTFTIYRPDGVQVQQANTTHVSSTAQTAANIGALLTGTGAVTFASLTVSGATVLTGNVSMAAGLTITQSSANTPAVSITGTGSGDGIRIVAGTTGSGIKSTGGATSGHGFSGIGVGNGDGMSLQGGSTGGDGLHATGGDGDGIKATAGTDGVGIRGSITGNLLGTVSVCTTNTDMITAAGVRTAIGLASANLDDQLEAIDAAFDGITVVFTDNVPANGGRSIIQENDYNSTIGNALVWTFTGMPTIPSDATVSMTATLGDTTFSVVGSRVSSTSVKVEIDGSLTTAALLPAGTYKMQVDVASVATWGAGQEVTYVDAGLLVKRKV